MNQETPSTQDREKPATVGEFDMFIPRDQCSTPGEEEDEAGFSNRFGAWLVEHGISLALSTYQTSRLYLIGADATGRISVYQRIFPHAMGLWATPEHLYLATRSQLWMFSNVVPPGKEYKGYDRAYVPRVGFITGELDAHDVGVDRQGRVVFVNTAYNCLATLSKTHSFRPLWRPPFISRLVGEDRCHLNGVAFVEGEPRYVTAVSRSDVTDGWRDRRRDGGCLIHVPSGEIVSSGLSMPHSPRWYRGRLWVLNSGCGELGWVDPDSSRFEPFCFCPGYARGLAFVGDYAIVGLSKPRERTFNGLALDDRLVEKDTSARCGLLVIDLRTGEIAHWMRFEGVVKELYDVQVLHGVRRPMAFGFYSDEIKGFITVEESSRHASPLRTEESAGESPARDPQKAAELYRQGKSFQKTGREEEAIACFEEALRLEPENARACNSLGVLLQARGRIDEAEALFRKALSIDPKLSLVHANLGNILFARKDFAPARAEYEECLRLDSGYLPAMLKLGEAYLAEHDPENARPWLQQALDRLNSPDSSTSSVIPPEKTKLLAEQASSLLKSISV